MEDSVCQDHDVCGSDDDEETVNAPSFDFLSKTDPNLSSAVADEQLDKTIIFSAFSSDSNSKEGDMSGLSCKGLHENEQKVHDTHVIERDLALNDENRELNGMVASSPSYSYGHTHPDDFGDDHDGRMPISVIGKSVLSFLDKKSCSDADEKMVDVMSEDKGWTMTSGFLSLNASDNSENEDCKEYLLPERCCSSFGNMFPNGMHIIIIPDYAICGGTLYTESQVTFSAESIKIDCSDPIGLDDKLVAEWTPSDVISLGCKWSASVDAALVKLCVRSNGMIKTKKHQGDPENVKIIFSISEANWTETEQRIINLAERYKKMWTSYSSEDIMWDDDISSNIHSSGGYLSNIEAPFEEVIYPKGDPDAVSLSIRDVELLQPEIFVNDTIIDFYIKYLKNKIPPNKKPRFHFFNSFFFRKLADLDKDRGSISEGRSAFLRVRKWTRKVNIFEKDYIFIPVNFNLHWSLLVICHPGEAAKMNEGDAKDFPKLPCILHMDSLKGTHSGVKSIIQSYIWEEWKERHPKTLENGSTNFSSLRFVSLELPQQENLFDCGLFLLHYVELFLEEAPLDLNPLKISRFSTFLTADWFQPSEASLKRSVIWNLIYELINDPGEQAVAPPCNNVQETIVEFLPERRSDSPKLVPNDGNFYGVVKYDVQPEVVLQRFQGAPVIPLSCYNGRLASPPNPEHDDGQGVIVELFPDRHYAFPMQVTDDANFCEVVKCDVQPELLSERHSAFPVEFPNDANFCEVVKYDLQTEVVLQEFQGAPTISNPFNNSRLAPPANPEHDDGQVQCDVMAEMVFEEFPGKRKPIVPSAQHLEHANQDNASHPAFTTAYCMLMDDACTSEMLVSTNISGEYIQSLDEQFIMEPCATSASHMDGGPYERPINPTEENAQHNLLHDASKLKNIDFREYESFVAAAADNSGSVTDFAVSICQKKLDTHTKEFQENDETKLGEVDSGGGPRVHANEKDGEDHQISCKIAGDFGLPRVDAAKEDGEDHHKSCQIAESGNAVSEDKDSPIGDAVMEVGDTHLNDMTEGKTEDCSTKAIVEEQACQQMPSDEVKTEDCDGQKYPSLIASRDEAIAGDVSHGAQNTNMIDAVNKNKDARVGDTVTQVGSSDTNNIEEDCSTKGVAEEQNSQKVSVDKGKTEDDDGQKNPSQIASPDEAIAGDALSNEAQKTDVADDASDVEDVAIGDTVIQVGVADHNNMIKGISEYCQEVAEEEDHLQMSVDESNSEDMVHQRPNKRRKLPEVHNRRRTRNTPRVPNSGSHI